MATVTGTYLGGLHVECIHESSGTRIETDAPVDNNGKGELFSPTDLAAASLGSCAMTIMGIYAREHGVDITGAKVSVDKTMGENPRRIAAIDIVYTMPDREYEKKHKKSLEAAARTCPVFQSLHPDTKKNITFVWPR